MNGTWSRSSGGQTQSKVRFVNGVCVPQREGTLRLNTNSWIACSTWSYVRPSIRTKGARYVSKLENDCAPAHSFCSVPRKLTIWPSAEVRCFGGAEDTAPATPPKPSSSNARSDQPAQYPASMSRSWMWMAPSRCAAPASAGNTLSSQ